MYSKTLYSYKAYSLTIASEFELPLAKIDATSSPDVTVTLAALKEPTHLHQTYDGVWYAFFEEGVFLKYETIGAYLIQNGTHITFSPLADPVDEKVYIIALLKTVMANLMFQRGRATIHGSCVAMEGKAFIFVGHKGRGKSTMAGFLHAAGGELVSDDVCAIEMDTEKKACVYPSYPSMKLWPDAMEFLEMDAKEYRKVHCMLEKRLIEEVANFSSVPVPLGGIVLLTYDESECSVTRIVGHEPFIELLPHQFMNRFFEGQPEGYVTQLYYHITSLLHKVPVYRLARPKDLSLLPEVRKTFVECVEKLSPI
jgi:hypothetical protein